MSRTTLNLQEEEHVLCSMQTGQCISTIVGDARLVVDVIKSLCAEWKLAGHQCIYGSENAFQSAIMMGDGDTYLSIPYLLA